MSKRENKLDQLSALFESASKVKLLDSLQRAKGNMEQAANIYLEETEKCLEKKVPLRQTKLELFFHDTSNSETLKSIQGDCHAGSKEQSLTEASREGQIPLKITSLNEILKWPPLSASKTKAKPKRNVRPVLRLYHAHDVAERTQCTLIHDVLPKDLANSLLKVMLEESETWQRNQWWLFERMVTSSHTASFYTSTEENKTYDGEVYYNGKKTESARAFLPEMEIARRAIRDIVNEKRKGRDRHEFEIQEYWNPNVAVANCYSNSREGVGWHSDELTYLGPRPIIGSLSLGATRQFRLRQIQESDEKSSRIISITLPHNSLLIMWPPTQELWKHEVCPQNVLDHLHPIAGSKRINITFREFREEYTDEWTPKCSCGIPCVLKPVMRSGPNNGRYFYMCYAGRAREGQNCGFFEWLDVSKRQNDYERKRLNLLQKQKNKSI
ncbi:6313_t:CDS:2 [Acaulospora morrowiae]|uniref:6313_t:CDS:1 n=1 Tax=Acaulospora morrowiae TaxID=94023 RepID=A0A9N9B0Y2_9GLOM|nr:6313_t:CDS:2 [Acaulospora morrowiae]